MSNDIEKIKQLKIKTGTPGKKVRIVEVKIFSLSFLFNQTITYNKYHTIKKEKKKIEDLLISFQ